MADVVVRKGNRSQPFLKPAFDVTKPVLLDDIRKELHNLKSLKDLAVVMNNVVRSGAQYALSYARQVVPVDTGRLKASLKVSQRGSMDWIVGTVVEYAVYQEYGTGMFNTGGPNNTRTKITILG